GIALTTDWQPGEAVIDNHALPLPPDIAPGTYQLILGLYDLNDPSQRLLVGEGDFLKLGEVVVRENE
ncbi:MAG: hypothetical protein ACPG7F_06105, partial [Aggregatilineales bacterium]